MLVYQIIDGFFTIPYEIYSHSVAANGNEASVSLGGVSVPPKVTDVSVMSSSDKICE
jgi:hypothetical protein